MARPRRFEQRIFLTLLVVALVPTALAVAAGAWALADVFERSGSAGPWAAVAGSGLGLVDALERTYPDIPICIHQDHGNNLATCLTAIQQGFT